MFIDTDIVSQELRKKAIDLVNQRLLLANLHGSEQEKDLNKPPNCAGYGRIHHFRRRRNGGWPADPLPMDPCSQRLGLPRVDTLHAQLFQVAFCNWRCWYCYVPATLLCADICHAAWLTAADIVDLYQQEVDAPCIIDLSGGQPDLTPEWIPWMMSELHSRGLDKKLYLWSDDNLSTDYFWRYLSDAQIRLISEYRNYGKVCCFKGFDATSFSFNTGANPGLFEQQFVRFRRYLDLRIDLYAYATFTSPDDADIAGKMAQFCDQLQTISENLPLRLVPLEIVRFTPMRHHMRATHDRAMKVQWTAIECWKHELKERFSPEVRGRDICAVQL